MARTIFAQTASSSSDAAHIGQYRSLNRATATSATNPARSIRKTPASTALKRTAIGLAMTTVSRDPAAMIVAAHRSLRPPTAKARA
jgi:hypothetical protein